MLSEKLLQKLSIIYTDEYVSDTYKISFSVLKENFIYINFKGFATNSDLNKGFEKRNHIIQKFGFDKKEYFEVWDYIHMPKMSREGRFILNENLSKENPNLLAIVFTNCSLQQEIILHTGFSFIKNSKTINTIIKSNDDAIDFGISLLKSNKEQRAFIINSEIANGNIVRNYVKSKFDELWNKNKEYTKIASKEYKIIRCQENVYFSDDNLFCANFDIIESNIIKIDFSGIVKQNDIDSVFKIKEQIVDKFDLNKSTIYQIFDFSKVRFKSRSKVIGKIKSHLLEPTELNNISLFSAKSIFTNQYLNLKNKKNLNKWIVSNNFEDAFRRAYIIRELYKVQSKISIPKQKKDKDILINVLQSKLSKLTYQHNFDIEQIIKFISQIAWDKQNKPINIENQKNQRLNNIFYAIKLVLEDNSDNVNVLNGQIKDLQEQNSILVKKLKALEEGKIQKSENININFDLN